MSRRAGLVVGVVAGVAIVLGLAVLVVASLTGGSNSSTGFNLTAPRPNLPHTPNLKAWCSMEQPSPPSRVLAERGPLGAYDLPFWQTVAGYAPNAIQSYSNTIVDALQARRDHRPFDAAKVAAATARIDAFAAAHCHAT